MVGLAHALYLAHTLFNLQGFGMIVRLGRGLGTRSLRLTATLGLLCCVAYPRARSQDTESVHKAKELRELADKGDPIAEGLLGAAYGNGDGVTSSAAESFRWYNLAAEQGNEDAAWHVALAYFSGAGVTEDQNEAARWWKKSGEQGDMETQFKQGVKRISDFWSLIVPGGKSPEDGGADLERYRKAAQQGNTAAQKRLAAMYGDGKGVKRDESESLVWWRRAAALGDPEAIRFLGFYYSRRNNVEASRWFLKGALQGDRASEYIIGSHYETGNGIPQSYSKAVYWDRKAAEQGDADAMRDLGVFAHYGQGMPQSYSEEMRWYRLAAALDDDTAMLYLGSMYAMGQGIPEDYALAVYWYQRSAELGNSSAMELLGIIYRDGTGVAVDNAEAFFWLNLSAVDPPPDEPQERDAVEAKLPPSKVAEEQSRCREWAKQHPKIHYAP